MNNQPIGIFDSGIGGLTIAQAVKKMLPNESIIYFGDTAHLPYGDKSTAAIQSYVVKICDLLIKRHCKVILIACNSASAAAYELAKEYVASKAKVINVIDPIVSHIGTHYRQQTIGLIGTQKTVSSNVYQKKINNLDADIFLKSLATKLLVPMIEEGYFNNNISTNIINNYLSDEKLSGIKALILGCTHYPLIKNEIEKYYKGSVEVIDASDIVAESLKNILLSNGLNTDTSSVPEHFFFVSDYTKSFVASTKIFFGEEVNLEYYPLWE
ncbi:MAG: glutamate racemase [Cytophagales bacterium]|nr:MAG: glutamate racemase [Cytophagales bacterium]